LLLSSPTLKAEEAVFGFSELSIFETAADLFLVCKGSSKSPRSDSRFFYKFCFLNTLVGIEEPIFDPVM